MEPQTCLLVYTKRIPRHSGGAYLRSNCDLGVLGACVHADFRLEHLQWCSMCDPANVFATSKFQLCTVLCNCVDKIGLQIGGRLLIATHLGQSNYLTNHQRSSKLIRLDLIYQTLSSLFQSPRKSLEQSNKHNQIMFIDSTLFLIGQIV